MKTAHFLPKFFHSAQAWACEPIHPLRHPHTHALHLLQILWPNQLGRRRCVPWLGGWSQAKHRVLSAGLLQSRHPSPPETQREQNCCKQLPSRVSQRERTGRKEGGGGNQAFSHNLNHRQQQQESVWFHWKTSWISHPLLVGKIISTIQLPHLQALPIIGWAATRSQKACQHFITAPGGSITRMQAWDGREAKQNS